MMMKRKGRPQFGGGANVGLPPGSGTKKGLFDVKRGGILAMPMLPPSLSQSKGAIGKGSKKPPTNKGIAKGRSKSLPSVLRSMRKK